MTSILLLNHGRGLSKVQYRRRNTLLPKERDTLTGYSGSMSHAWLVNGPSQACGPWLWLPLKSSREASFAEGTNNADPAVAGCRFV